MRNLKKVLSLVLVVAMLASMMIVGAAAAETEETKYPEAAAVIAGIGVMEGDENGMRYGDTVTREEAAAILCRVLLGDTAATLKTTTAPFADVAASRWSAGYIAYLKNQGIVSGVSDTEFDPTAKVTGIQFAKMLLTAVGYGKNDEFEGAQWDINTITFANDTGVFTTTKAADLAASATREECMLYAFNTLTKIPTVKYNKTFESYYTGSSALDPVTGDVDPTNTGANAPYAYTLGWTKYSLVKVTGPASIDDFGRPAATWTASGVYVADAIAHIEPTAVLTGAVYSTNLYATLGKAVVGNLNDPNSGAPLSHISVYVDGQPETNTINGGTGAYSVPWGAINPGEFTNQISKTGATVELYKSQSKTTGDYYLTIVVSYEHLGEVTRVVTAGGVTTLTIADVAGGTTTVTSEQLDVTGIAKKDMVIYTKGATAVASIAVATPVVGTYTNYNNTMLQYTIDGTGVSASAVADASALTTYGASYEIYYNSLGNILYAVEYDVAGVTGTYQYLYLQGAQAQAKGSDLINNDATKVAFDVVYPNGGQEIVYAAIKTDSTGDYFLLDGVKTYVTVDAADYTGTVAKGWYSYTTNDAGAVTLKAINNDYANDTTAITTATGKAAITGIASYTANKATVLNVVNEDGIVVTYTGIANFPANTFGAAGNTVLYTYAKNSKVLVSVTAFVGSSPVTSNLNLAYCSGNWQSDDNGTTYMFYVDGALKFITLDVAAYVNAYNSIDFSDGLDSAETTALNNYNTYVPVAGNIYDLTVSDGEYTAEKVGSYNNTGATNDEGTVNAGYGFSNAGAAGQVNYGIFNLVNFTYSYYEWATVDTVDDNFFTTVEVDVDGFTTAQTAVTTAQTAVTTAQTAYDTAKAASDADPTNDTKVAATAAALATLNTKKADLAAAQSALADLMGDTVGGINVPSYTYYFDANTVVYDCTAAGQGKQVDGISTGDVFVAYIDEAASITYGGAAYASHIWIVG